MTLIKRISKVAVLIGTSEEVDRGLLLGILKYGKLHGPWWFSVFPTDFSALQRSDWHRWEGDGIIAHIKTEKVAEQIVSRRLPTITIDLPDRFFEISHSLCNGPEIRGNSEKVGVMAAEFFLEKRFTNFAFLGEASNINWSKKRETTFASCLEEAGYDYFRFAPSSKFSLESQAQRKRLGRWLESLPKPVGLFAANDTHACLALDACLDFGIRVPDDISLLGVDNDPIRCELTEPSLSSIARNHESAGYHAAQHLDLMMKGRKTERTVFSIEPTVVAERRSTVAINLDDSLVAKAVSFIGINSGLGMNVDSVVKYLQVSRRLLEQRFRKSLGRTVHDEIERVRMNKVKNMLLETNKTLCEIAEICSFSSEMYLSNVFHKRFGMTMGQFRNKNKGKVY